MTDFFVVPLTKKRKRVRKHAKTTVLSGLYGLWYSMGTMVFSGFIQWEQWYSNVLFEVLFSRADKQQLYVYFNIILI